eukprot:1275938-Rhodomonas_salina.1
MPGLWYCQVIPCLISIPIQAESSAERLLVALYWYKEQHADELGFKKKKKREEAAAGQGQVHADGRLSSFLLPVPNEHAPARAAGDEFKAVANAARTQAYTHTSPELSATQRGERARGEELCASHRACATLSWRARRAWDT